jgi:prolyl oligopeptidase family protein
MLTAAMERVEHQNGEAMSALKKAIFLVTLPLLSLGGGAYATVSPAPVNVLPGPDILNAPPARAPQFENVGIWQAAPILISGASAYRKGEFLYQDFLYDDRGAVTNGNAGPTALSRSGHYSYPTNVAAFFENLADFVEVRLKLNASDTAFRLTYNSMSDPALVAATIAIGGTAGVLRTIPFGANAAEPADVFITVHGTSAVVTDAATGVVLANLSASADIERRQIEVRLPFTTYDPRGKTSVRIAAATGLWNSAGSTYLIPGTTATATTPGGAGTNVPNPPAFFNVAFRYNEPDPSLSTYTRWRDGVQGSTLAAAVSMNGVQTHDLSPFAATVDFVKLASGVDDDLPGQVGGVPQTGFIDRIYSSRFEVMQGVGNPAAPNLMKSQGCTPTSTVAANGTTSCVPQFTGRLQPYAVYVPVKTPPASGYGLITDLHGAGDNYNRNPPVTWEREVSLGERGTGSIVYVTEGRGTQYWWWGSAGSEIWEVMAAIKRAYNINPEAVVASGISQGGYSTWKQATMFPDLYAAAVPHVPCPSAGTGYNGNNAPGGADSFAYPMIDSLRYVPVVGSVGGSDGTCTGEQPFAQGNFAIRAKLDSLGYRFEWWSFNNQGHIFAPPSCAGVTANNPIPASPKPCGFSFEADFLDSVAGVGNLVTRVVNPPHITYSVNEGWNEPLFGFVGDHAYWISSVTVRDPAVSPYGKVDVISKGFGLNDPVANATQIVNGTDYTLNQNTFHAYNRWDKTWNPPTTTTANDEIDIVATNISKVVIDPIRARVDCNAVVNVQSDGPISVVIHGCLNGDVNLDDVVDCHDIFAAKAAIGARRGDPNYDPRIDMNSNGVIELTDAVAVSAARTSFTCN